MKIVIFGLARSGTTALFYKIKNSLPSNTLSLFEPRSFDPRNLRKRKISSFLTGTRKPDVLAKVLPFRPHASVDAESFSDFEKQILIVRDPRDRLISRLLYGVYHSNFYHLDNKVTALVQDLKSKEADPGSMPVKTLLASFANLNCEDFSWDDWAMQQHHISIRRPLDFHNKRSGLFLFKYEDMIDQRLDQLNNYLGLTLKETTCVPPELTRVTRTKNYGAWRHWLTADDVEYLGPILQPFLDRYYPETDWKVSKAPSIPAEHGSLYIQRIVNERRAAMNLPAFVQSDAEELTNTSKTSVPYNH
jgi:hypothetical protein